MDTDTQAADETDTSPSKWWSEQSALYSHGEHRPEGSFTAIMAAYGLTAVGLGLVIRRHGRLPEQVSGRDLALLSVATFKLSRLIAKDPVTSPLRMPFTTFAGTSGEAELAEDVRGTGPRKAIGELVTCPFCVGMWVATGFGAGIVLAPRATRLMASVFAMLAGSDVMQFGYAALEEKVTG